MTEILVLGLFMLALLLCLFSGMSVLLALVVGFFLFFTYGCRKGHSPRAMMDMALVGVKSVANILSVVICVGTITALWRACGTIPYIVSLAAGFFDPRFMVLITFLLCVALSTLTGTAFGTAATMGVICVTVANGMGISPVLSGGAVVAGSYFGDRCSPMSTGALLVSAVTGTEIYRNIANMVRTGAVPFLLSCCAYLLMGWGPRETGASVDVAAMFSAAFSLEPVLLLPALAIVLLSVLRIAPRNAMCVSILAAVVLCVVKQGMSAAEILQTACYGYYPEDESLTALLSGGGIFSMAKVFFIILISATYSGMFDGTGLLRGFRDKLTRLSRHILPFGCIFFTALVTNMIACNQTLSIMITRQLCADVEPNGEKMAVALENTAVVLAPLIPWSVASSVATASANVPPSAALAACFLYLLPIWNYLMAIMKKEKKQ